MKLFAQIQKVDEEKRLVIGRAADETVDKSSEALNYAASKPHFIKWSEDIAKDTDGKSLGNVRAMHGKVAAGKLTDMRFDDAACTIDVCAKIVDDAEWKKVLEGVYTGFSIGGSYGAKTVEKIADKDVTRYVAIPNEISLVDRPCIPTAKFFEVQKSDGTLAKVEFQKAQSDDEYMKELHDGLASNANGEERGMLADAHKAYLNSACFSKGDFEGHPFRGNQYKEGSSGDAVHHSQRARGNETKANHSKAASVHTKVAARTSGVTKTYHEKMAAFHASRASSVGKADVEVEGTPDQVAELGKLMLEKGLSLADTIELVKGVAKSVAPKGCDQKKWDSMSVDEQKAWLAEEERAETIDEETAEKKVDVVLTKLEAAMSEAALLKIGARNNAGDKGRIEAIHKAAVELGAVCTGNTGGASIKADGLQANDLEKLVTDAIAPLQKVIEEANAKIAKLEAEPRAPMVNLRAVSKAEDNGGGTNVPTENDLVKDSDGVAHPAASLIKQALQTGGRPMLFRG